MGLESRVSSDISNFNYPDICILANRLITTNSYTINFMRFAR